MVKRDAFFEAENVPSVLARKKKAAAVVKEVQSELVPIAEMRDRPSLNPGDTLIVCKKGPLFGREAEVVRSSGARVEVKVNKMNVGLKLTEVSLPIQSASLEAIQAANQSIRPPQEKGNSISKAAERAIAAERNGKRSGEWEREEDTSKGSNASLAIRTAGNTVDVRGLNLREAQDKVKEKFSSSLLSGRPVTYILHGHGTGGVLKSKIRQWLQSERQLVKRFEPASAADGGDAFTRVELR